jgi:hypothetical protein
MTGAPPKFYGNTVRWRIIDPNPVGFARGLEERIIAGRSPSAWCPEVTDMSNEIARNECRGYLQSLLMHSFLFWDISVEWPAAFSLALEAYPVAQVQSLIFNAAKETVATRSEADRDKEGLKFLSNFETLLAQARIDSKAPASVERQTPRSPISFVFYDLVFRARDSGFTKLPGTFRFIEDKPQPKPVETPKYRVPLNKKVILDAIEHAERFETNADPSRVSSLWRRLLAVLAGLSAADRAQVAVVMLIGRGDDGPENFDETVAKWTRPLDSMQPEYLAGKTLARFLRVGLSRLAAHRT